MATHAVFQGGVRPPPLAPFHADKYAVDARFVNGGALLGSNLSALPGSVYRGNVRLGARSQCLFVAGAFSVDGPEHPAGLPAYKGVVQRVIPTGGIELTGDFALRIGGGERLRAHRSFLHPIDRVLPPRSTTTVTVPVPAGMAPRFGDTVTVAYRTQHAGDPPVPSPTAAPTTGLPPDIVVSGSVTGTMGDGLVSVVFFHGGELSPRLLGYLRIGLWQSEPT